MLNLLLRNLSSAKLVAFAQPRYSGRAREANKVRLLD